MFLRSNYSYNANKNKLALILSINENYREILRIYWDNDLKYQSTPLVLSSFHFFFDLLENDTGLELENFTPLAEHNGLNAKLDLGFHIYKEAEGKVAGNAVRYKEEFYISYLNKLYRIKDLKGFF